MATGDIRGQFLWHDLMTSDKEAAGVFYPKVTGWTTEDWEKDPSYSLWVAAGGPRGGSAALSEDAANSTEPYWLSYIGTPDLGATIDAAERLGGRTIKGITDIASGGQYAVLADPQGAVFGVYSSESATGNPPPDFGDFVWHELHTSDQDAALEFYSELFGWEKHREHDMGQEGVYTVAGLNGQDQIGLYARPGGSGEPSHWLPYVKVPDVSEAAKSAEASGGSVALGPMEVPGGSQVVMLLDPQGGRFAVIQHPEGEMPRKKKGKSGSRTKPKAVPEPESFALESPPAPEVSEAPRKASKPKKKAVAGKAAPTPAKRKSKAKASPGKTGKGKKSAKKKVSAASSRAKPAAKKSVAKKTQAVARKGGKKKAAAKKAVAKKKGASAGRKTATKVAAPKKKKSAARKK